MAYKRLISYFDLIADEQKRGNAGFVKWEKYDECHILSVFVSGLEGTLNKETKVYLDESVLGTLSVRGGRAEGTYLLTGADKEQKESIEKIKIVLDNTRMLVAEFETKENFQPKKPVAEEEPIMKREKPVDKAESIPEATEVSKEIPVTNLWEQLGRTHEPFYPFNNEEKCFRIFPKDLKLLQPEYYAFQSNQFLMHGYYNYRHLIIFRRKDENNGYWLGVPGIYHEREKMAARMFGFEKFEAANKDYRTGDLGYYLVAVK